MHPNTASDITPIKLVPANILRLGSDAIGTSLKDSKQEKSFYKQAEEIVRAFDFDAQPVLGQGYIPATSLTGFLLSGVGLRTENPDDYVLRCHRGRVDAYLKRSHALPAKDVALIVYTRDAYFRDPDVVTDYDEVSRVVSLEATHILVAVLASAGPKSPLSPVRFVANLAGGNREAATWSPELIRAKAGTVMDYDKSWCVVAGDDS